MVFARVDFLLGQKVIVEFDGLMKYADAAGREALAAEKQREDLLRSLGYEVVRLTWADLARPKRVEALIRSAMRRVEARSSPDGIPDDHDRTTIRASRTSAPYQGRRGSLRVAGKLPRPSGTSATSR